MANFSFTPLEVPDIILVESRGFPDARGYFMETYRRSAFAAGGISAEFDQDNRSLSRRGVVRGLHYQLAAAPQAKLVSVAHGEIFDVAVDVRHGSPTFGRWVAQVLSAENRRSLYVPAGFAHGFQALSDTALVTYKTSGEYDPASERGVLWNDPELGIPWPLAPATVSEKDAALPPLREADTDFEYRGAPRPSARNAGSRTPWGTVHDGTPDDERPPEPHRERRR